MHTLNWSGWCYRCSLHAENAHKIDNGQSVTNVLYSTMSHGPPRISWAVWFFVNRFNNQIKSSCISCLVIGFFLQDIISNLFECVCFCLATTKIFVSLFVAILQRNTVDVGQIRLIGIATCLYLCMDTCGNLYSSVCIFGMFLLALKLRSRAILVKNKFKRQTVNFLSRRATIKPFQFHFRVIYETNRSCSIFDLENQAEYPGRVAENSIESKITYVCNHFARQHCAAIKHALKFVTQNQLKWKRKCRLKCRK